MYTMEFFCIKPSQSSSQWAGSSFLDRIVRGLCCLFLKYQLITRELQLVKFQSQRYFQFQIRICLKLLNVFLLHRNIEIGVWNWNIEVGICPWFWCQQILNSTFNRWQYESSTTKERKSRFQHLFRFLDPQITCKRNFLHWIWIRFFTKHSRLDPLGFPASPL